MNMSTKCVLNSQVEAVGESNLLRNLAFLYTAGKVEQGQEVVPWMGPAPPYGMHRYTFLLFENARDEPITVRSCPMNRARTPPCL